jgi:predicted dehydrogenase
LNLLDFSVVINRILIVSNGNIGKRHLRLARKILPNADIRILRHQAACEVPEYSNGCFSSIEESIAFAPQVAVIASPAPFHIPTGQALAEVGVHLLIEKPLSASLSGVMQLLKTSQKQGTVLQSGYNLRFSPSLRRFRDLLGESVIGKVLSVRCEVGQYLPTWRPDCDYRQGVSARHELGGGALLELSHELDYLRWIFGEVDWVKATLSHQSDLELDVEDTAHLTLGFVPAVDGHQLIGAVNMDFIRHDTTRLCTAIGENSSLRWNGLTGGVALYEAGAKEWRELFSHPHQLDESYLAELQNFLACVIEHKKPLVTGKDGLKVLEIIEAARISAESGVQVAVAQVSKVNP